MHNVCAHPHIYHTTYIVRVCYPPAIVHISTAFRGGREHQRQQCVCMYVCVVCVIHAVECASRSWRAKVQEFWLPKCRSSDNWRTDAKTQTLSPVRNAAAAAGRLGSIGVYVYACLSVRTGALCSQPPGRNETQRNFVHRAYVHSRLIRKRQKRRCKNRAAAIGISLFPRHAIAGPNDRHTRSTPMICGRRKIALQHVISARVADVGDRAYTTLYIVCSCSSSVSCGAIGALCALNRSACWSRPLVRDTRTHPMHPVQHGIRTRPDRKS